jgi:type IV secretory pathway VirJ component
MIGMLGVLGRMLPIARRRPPRRSSAPTSPAASARSRSRCPSARSAAWCSCFPTRPAGISELDRAAARLGALGAAVLEVDLPAYIANLRQSDDRDCQYLISEIEEASKRLQRELGLERYLSSILAGTGMGSALAALVAWGGFGALSFCAASYRQMNAR